MLLAKLLMQSVLQLAMEGRQKLLKLQERLKLQRERKVQTVQPGVIFEPQFGVWTISQMSQQQQQTLAISPSLSHTVKLLDITSGSVSLDGKCKVLLIDNCTDVTVHFHSVVVALEVVNCRGLTVTVDGSCSTLRVDLSHGVLVQLAPLEADAKVQIFSSATTALAIEVPTESAGSTSGESRPIHRHDIVPPGAQHPAHQLRSVLEGSGSFETERFVY